MQLLEDRICTTTGIWMRPMQRRAWIPLPEDTISRTTAGKEMPPMPHSYKDLIRILQLEDIIFLDITDM